MAHIEYPGLPTDYVMEMVHRFYDEYYFRPKAAFRVVWKAIVNRDVPRLYVEAKAFLKLRAQRNKMVKANARIRLKPRHLPAPARKLACPSWIRPRAAHGDCPLFLLPIGTPNHDGAHTLTPRQYLILGLVALCAPLGDTCLSRGMTLLPPISLAHPGSLIAAVFTPWIGDRHRAADRIFASYLTALSWADLTFVLPATAFGNVIVALFARFWLHEYISTERWAGIALITLGVSFVANGPSRTEEVTASSAELPDPVAAQESQAAMDANAGLDAVAEMEREPR